MPDGVRAELVGEAELHRSLDRFARTLPDTAPAAAARIIGAQARANAPTRTGRLSASFSADTGDGVQTLGFGAAYAAPIHWGTGARVGLRGPHNIRPSLYLSRAIESTREAWEGAYLTDIDNQLSRVKGA